MHTRRIQYLCPDEVLAEMKRAPVAYQPCGLLEWHGPHLPLGVDSLNAEHVALMAAERSGGLVMPPLYFGTERERPPEVLDWIGFENKEWVVGMDFPANSLPSMYASEELFALVVRENIRLIAVMGFKILVLVTGHAAVNQLEVLQRLSVEFNALDTVRVLVELPFVMNDEGIMEVGHASKIETSVMLELAPETVKLENLPEKEIPLKNVDFAIVDYPTFIGRPTTDRTVRKDDDPRFATAEAGRRSIERAVTQIVRDVAGELDRIHELN